MTICFEHPAPEALQVYLATKAPEDIAFTLSYVTTTYSEY